MTPSPKPVALVTGANKGIGFEVARAIAKAGYVVLVDHEAWRRDVEVRQREGVGILRVEGGAEHVHRPIGLRTEGSGHLLRCPRYIREWIGRERSQGTQGH